MSLAPFPVPQKFVAQYGRARAHFPAAVEFTVPLLCAVRMPHEASLFYYIFDVSDEWENWKLAMPTSSDNHVLCHADPLDVKGKPTASRKTDNGYNWCTVAELRRRLSFFWHNSIVSMHSIDSSLTWIPMECADPFNLLGFTCLPSISSIDVSNLPEWKINSISFDALAITTVKPVFVNGPVDATTLQRYTDLPKIEMSAAESITSNREESVELAFDVSQGPVTLDTLKRHPSIANIRDYLRTQLDMGCSTCITIIQITEVYNMNAQNIAYLCALQEIDKPLWISEHLLECLEINDSNSYRKYQAELLLFQRRLAELTRKDFDEF